LRKLRRTPPGYIHGKHRAPQRQIIVVTSGIGAIELDDGSTWRFGPGDVIFAENTSGEGHVTRALEGVRGFMHVTVPDSFDVSTWPLLS
jgi:quercetin dioxygenase-like cupin family protein